MSRITKWKLEKNKVKVVFRLQFNATHIPQSGWDKLFISFIPADSGKTIAKTTKANVRNGTCKWGDPIYETTRLLQDVKSKQFDEKLYKLVVSMGSSRSSILGEATINLADYADALRPSIVALSLHGCNAGTILHVTVQLLTSKTGFREFEQQRELRERGLQSVDSGSATGKVLISGETRHDHIDKVSSRVRFRPDAKELSSVEEEVELNEECTDSTAGFDGSSNTSESQNTERHESSSAHENDSQAMAAQSSSSVHGYHSTDNELANAYEENNKLRASLESAESAIFELKLEVSTLQTQANELASETERFSQLLTSEISSGEVLAKEVSTLRSECSYFKDFIEKHGTESGAADSGCHLVEDMQLILTKGISAVEDRIKEVQNKVCLGFYERDYRFLHSELEALLQVLHEVKRGARDEISSINKVTSMDVKETVKQQPLPGLGSELDLCAPENLLHHIGIPPMVSQGTDSAVAIDAMKAKIFDLVRELDEAKFEKENLLRKMDQMECYYEALVQELEENQKQMLAELHTVRNEHSTCLYTISSSKAEMELMRQDMGQRLLQLASEKCDVDALNKEFKRRAEVSEAALRRARLNYSIAVDKLQKDLELLSSQVVSMFETNENLIKQAIPEPSHSQLIGHSDSVRNSEEYDKVEQLPRKLTLGGDVVADDLKRSLSLQEEIYRKVGEELDEIHSVNLHLDIFSRVLLETVIGANVSAGAMKKDMNKLLEDVRSLHEEKASSVLKFSDLVRQNQALKAELESLLKENRVRYEAFVEENTALSTSLKHETSKNSGLQDEISILKDDLLTVRAKSEDLASSNENLYEDITLVKDKLAGMLSSYDKELSPLCGSSSCHELEFNDIRGLTMRLEEVQHNVCNKIVHLLQEKQNLVAEKSVAEISLTASRSEVIAVKQKFKSDIQSMVAKLDVSTSLVEKLQVELESMTNKLRLTSEVEEKYAQQNRELLVDLVAFEVELTNLVSKNGHVAREMLGLKSLADELGRNDTTICELMREKEGLMISLHDKTEEFAVLTSEVSYLRDNLRSLQDKLQLERGLKDELEGSVQSLTLQLNEKNDRLVDLEKQNAELDRLLQQRDEHAAMLQEAWSIVSGLECSVQDLTCQLNEKCDGLLDLEKQNAELVSFRQLAADLEMEKCRLNQLVQQRDEDVVELQKELSCVSGLESSVRDLTSQLNEKRRKLLDLEKQNAELAHFRQLASDLEVEKSDFDKLLQQRDEHVAKLQEAASLVSGLESSVQDLTSQLNEKCDRLLVLEKQNAELVNFRQLAVDLEMEKSRLDKLVQQRDEHLAKLQEDLSCISGLEGSVRDLDAQLNEKNDRLLDLEKLNAELVHFRQLASELGAEKSRVGDLVSGLESSVQDLTSQLNEKSDRLLDLEKQNVELVNFRKLISDLEVENSRLDQLLQQRDEHVARLQEDLGSQLNEKNDRLQQRNEQMEKLREELSDVSDLKSLTLLEVLEFAVASDVKFTVAMSCCEKLDRELVQQIKSSDGSVTEIQKKCHDLQTSLKECLESEARLIQENKELLSTLGAVRSDLEASVSQSNIRSDSENEEEFNQLLISKEKLEITVIVLRAKLDEMATLQSQCNELARKLSEQALKTEEFKNLSVHLKELKDKADAECFRAREKRESEGTPVVAAAQESLRIAFIKEQYESKLVEMRQQVSMSKRHGEDMLLKLQDALDEIESRKRSEALHLKKNEDLALKILTLESELQSLLSYKREMIKDHDRIKAELECALLSLECCKEEKEKLEVSLGERARENSRIGDELISTREQLESIGKKENGHMDKVELAPNDSSNARTVKETASLMDDRSDESSSPVNRRLTLDAASIGVHATTVDAPLDGYSPASNGSHKDFGKEHFGSRNLRSSMEHLHEELERMKRENSLVLEDQCPDPGFEVLQSELMQLHKVNEELRSMFPTFTDVASTGNALERVLALEIELAEALKAKNKSSIFQSSFLKQHRDDEAIFKSFKDINELIENMLEIKEKHVAMENELREMHDRYSQLSLQFAEVEGERQKLKMTLKNVRASKSKLVQLNRSSSSILDSPS